MDALEPVTIHATIGSLADAARTRLLLLLGRHELSVNELCAVVQMPQSTVSRHLKVLVDEGWLVSRADGPSRYYRMSGRLEPTAKRLWQVVREDLTVRAESVQDEARVEQVLHERRTRSQEYFASFAGQWEKTRADLFGAHAGFAGLMSLLGDDLVIGDLGCGTGVVAAELAPVAGRVIAVDESKAMLSAAKRRVSPFANVELRFGQLESLPISAGELDAAVLSLVLHYIAEPERVLSEARRAMKVGGRVVVVDMMAHGRADYREQMGHVWQGFREDQMRGWMEECGFERMKWRGLTAATDARGPMLFAMSGVAGA